MTEKTYIGDGAYAELDAYGRIVLTTESGITIENTVVLEPEVWASLIRFEKRARERREQEWRAREGLSVVEGGEP